VHPIERLRWIARARGEAPTTLAAEAAWTISELAADEPAAVVTACRRLVESHVTAGPLWWVAASVLVAPDPDRASRRVVDELLSDPTADLLAKALSDRFSEEGTFVIACPVETVLEAFSQLPYSVARVVGSPARCRAEVHSFEAFVHSASGWDFDEAYGAVDGASVVLIEAFAAGSAGVLSAPGTAALAEAAREASVPIWAVVPVGRLLDSQLLAEMLRRAGDGVELISPELIEAVVGPSGLETPVEGLGRQLCPPAPELLVRAG
jgi:hypothetical protein